MGRCLITGKDIWSGASEGQDLNNCNCFHFFFRKNVLGIGCSVMLREKSKCSQQHTLTSITTTSAEDFHKHGDEKPPFRPEHPAIKITTPRGMFSALAPRE